MNEKMSSGKKETIEYNSNDLTPFEHAMIGSSVNIIVNGSEKIVNSEVLEQLRKDKNALRIILTPINLSQGARALDEISQARKNKGTLSKLPLSGFEFESQWKYVKAGVEIVFKLGDLDQNGQLEKFEISLEKNDRKISAPVDSKEGFPIHKNYINLIEYVESKNETMKFKIKK
jgi:hypothetical protein